MPTRNLGKPLQSRHLLPRRSGRAGARQQLRRRRPLIERALDLGVNYIDTRRSTVVPSAGASST